MARDAYALPDKGAIIFWSRKSGNTSLSEWITDIIRPVKEGERRSVRPRKFLKANNYHVDFREALDLIEKHKLADFVLARDPYRRIVSSYVEKFVYYEHDPIDSLSRLKQFSRRAFLDLMALKGKPSDPASYEDNYPGISFNDFLKYIGIKVEERRRRGEPDLNGHWNTQVPFFYDKRFDYSNIIRLERVTADIFLLQRKLGAELPFPHSRSNAVHAAFQDSGDLAEVSSVEMIRSGIVPGAGALLTKATRQLIREAYEIDFRKLGYDPSTPAQS